MVILQISAKNHLLWFFNIYFLPFLRIEYRTQSIEGTAKTNLMKILVQQVWFIWSSGRFALQ